MGYGDVSFSMATPLLAWGSTFLKPVMLLAIGNREFAALNRITTLHFAGFATMNRVCRPNGFRRTLERPVLLFFSLFDGAADSYLADFSVLVPDYIDTLWGKCLRYPGGRDFDRFMFWLGEHALTPIAPEHGGATSFEYHGYRVHPETTHSGAVPEGPDEPADPCCERGDGRSTDRRLAPMPLIAKALELRRRLKNALRFWDLQQRPAEERERRRDDQCVEPAVIAAFVASPDLDQALDDLAMEFL